MQRSSFVSHSPPLLSPSFGGILLFSPYKHFINHGHVHGLGNEESHSSRAS